MFRIDDNLVVDATMKGNAARFINHSCDVSVQKLEKKCTYCIFYSPIATRKWWRSWDTNTL